MPDTPVNYQSPYTAASLTDHLAGASQTVATCWKLVSTTGVIIGATSNTRDLVLPGHTGVTFRAKNGMTPTAVDFDSEEASSGLEVDTFFGDELLEADLRRGVWDDAQLYVLIVNYMAPGMGQLIMQYGHVGIASTEGFDVKFEARPLSSKSRQMYGNVTKNLCRCEAFGDERCRANLTPFTHNGTVTTGDSNEIFTDSSRTEAADYFTNGRITFTSGALAGTKAQIKKYDSVTKVFQLKLSVHLTIPAGTTYTAIRGCPRTREFCASIGNILNMRAEPDLPGPEKVYRIRRAAGAPPV